MDAMVVHVEPLNQAPFEHFDPWHCHEARDRDDGASVAPSVLLPAAISSLHERLSQRISRTGSAPSPCPNTYDGPVSPTSMSSPPSKSCPPAPSGPHSTLSPPPTVPSQQTTASSATALLSEPSATISFTRILTPMQLTIRSAPSPPFYHLSPSIKRERPASDVDGPQTAALSIKKRRLLRQRITSRLSQPFSQPDSHVIARQSTPADGPGDPRLLRVAAMASARRLIMATHHQQQQQLQQQQQCIHPPSASSVLRRAAILNRFRLRVCREAADRGDAAVANIAGNAALLRQTSQQLGVGLGLAVGARFPAASSNSPESPPSSPPSPILPPPTLSAALSSPQSSSLPPKLPTGTGSNGDAAPRQPPAPVPRPVIRPPAPSSPMLGGLLLPPPVLTPPLARAASRRPAPIPLPAQLQPDPTHPHPLSRAAAEARSSPPSSPKGLRPTSGPGSVARSRISPGLRPLRSPEMRGTRSTAPLRVGADQDDEDDEASFYFGGAEDDEEYEGEVAFPTSEHESRYMYDDGDDDGVYADFSVIFGGGSSAASPAGDDGDEERQGTASASNAGSGPGPVSPGGVAGIGEVAAAAGDVLEGYLDDVDGIPWMAR